MSVFLSRLWPFVLKFAVGMFWCWNIIFICSTLPILPALPTLIQEMLFEDVPFNYAFIMLAWITAPWLCAVLAQIRLRERPEALAFLFFAVEGPFYSLSLYRLIILRELTPAIAQWLTMIALGLCIYGVDTLIRPLPKTPAWQTLRLMATTCLALVGLYCGALVLLAWSPLALRGLWEMFNPLNWYHVLDVLLQTPWLLVFVPLWCLSVLFIAGTIIAMPLCMTVLCLRAFALTWRDKFLPLAQRTAAVLAMLILQGVIYAQVNHQPQKEAFALLASPALTPAQFASQQQMLREGLLNAYLAAYRYASARAESNGLKSMYQNLLGLNSTIAELPQAAFNTLAEPLLYDGDNMQEDAKRAAELYEQYFDSPIQRGEHAAIVRALSATYNQDERESGLINIDQRKVWLAEQNVRVQAQGDLANVTLEESYVNLSSTPQEIFYLFSLPESAAITGLWLGAARDAMQPYVIATRGAAQRVYKAEVKRSIDPALLEQVGPRQYRLRAYPVPVSPHRHGEARFTSNSKLYLRLQYTTLARNNAWPLPVLAEKRNVGWDRRTIRRCDGGACPGDLSTWWPAELPIKQPPAPMRHAVTLDASGRSVIAQPAQTAIPKLTGKKITLVLDRSWSMAAHRQELLAAINTARQQMAGNSVMALLTSTPVMQQTPRLVPLAELTDEMLTDFIGGGRVDQLLQQAVSHISEPQDLTVILTDNGAFDLDADKTRARLQSGMLGFVHLGGILAPAYDDATLETVQASGGSAFVNLQEAWEHFARAQNAAPGFLLQRDGYAFSLEENANKLEDAAFAPIAARLFIASATRQSNPLSMAQLDVLHTLAQNYSVVTPYSSMLVLVNPEQQQALAQAEAGNNRFERAQEQGVETLQKPSNPLSAKITPEPEEWLLLLASLGVGGWMLWLRKRSGAESLKRH